MTRAVALAEATALPPPRGGVVVRPVDQHDDGLPVARDLQMVHRVLEESFEDHFSSYRELPRVRHAPAGGPRSPLGPLVARERPHPQGLLPPGALVCSVLWPDRTGTEGTYVDSSASTVARVAVGSPRRCCTP